MSEVVEGAVTATAGQLLRDARQASGMHIAALAVALKVPVSKLEALEADNYAALPDTVFVRALASSVCRTLKVEPGPILSLLPQSQSPRLAANSAGLNAPVKASAGKSSSSPASFSSGSGARPRSVSLVVLVLLVGALAVFFFPREPGALSFLLPQPKTQPGADVVEPVSAPSAVSGVPSSQPNSDAVAAADKTASPAAASPAAPAPAASMPAVGTTPAAVATAAVASDPASPAASAPVQGTLVLRARSQSWVQVKDAAGAVVLQRNLASDESVAVNAPAPLAVVIGRADATEVMVRGKPFDLSGVSRENVARFEVK